MAIIKVLVDYLKHFFLTRMNKISIFFYSGMRKDILKKLHTVQKKSLESGETTSCHPNEQEVNQAQKKIKWNLLTT